MTPVESENARHMALAGYLRGKAESSAPARPALRFSLDATTLEDARAWARHAHVHCEEPRVGLIRCANVESVALGLEPAQGPIDELELEFDGGGLLVNVTTFRTHLAPDVASREAHAIVSFLAQQLGPANASGGDFGAATFGAPSALSISSMTYRYADYVADVTGMNAPSGGATIREHYMSAKD
jgi:hypothetical protein